MNKYKRDKIKRSKRTRQEQSEHTKRHEKRLPKTKHKPERNEYVYF